jgi:dsRNA-specific ribonuclease
MTDLYTEILEFEKMKNIDRDQLVEDYAQQMIESMDYKTMERFVYDTMVENLTDYTDEELITEVTDYYPELLGDVDTL